MSYDVQVEELGANRRGLVTSEEGRAIVEFMKTSRANMCFEYRKIQAGGAGGPACRRAACTYRAG